jgi:hypothetical protein
MTAARPHGAIVVAWLVLLIAAAAAEASAQAPALNAPPALPTDSAAYGDDGLRLAVLMQVRADFPGAGGSPSTFFLRKAEVGIRARVAPATHLSVELDPVRPADPFRRTYLRLSHLPWLHVKLGMEKAPIGLEELLSSARVPFVDRSEVSDRYAAAEEVGVHLESRWEQWLVQVSVTNGGRRLLRDDNDHKDVSARLAWAPRADFSIGVAALDGRVGAAEDDRRRLNGELRLGSGDSGIQAELYDAKDAGVASRAFYVSAFRAVATDMEWLPLVQPVVRYERIDRDGELSAEELDLLTMGLSLLFDGHRSKLQVNYLWDLRPGLDEDGLRVQYQVEF